MKKKVLSVLFALVLVLSFSLVTAVPVSANLGGVEFATVGDTATAGLTTEDAYSGDYSVKFHAEAWGEDGYAMGILVDIPLNEFTELSYWRNGMGMDYAPLAVLLCIDADDDGKLDFGTDDILSGDPSLLGDDAFIEIGADWIEPGWVEVDGFAGPVSGGWLYGGGSWTDKNGWSGYLTYSSLEEVIAAGGFLPSDGGDPCPIDPTDNVMLVVIAGGNPDFSATYIDDVIINGKTYDFEPPPPPDEVWVDDGFTSATLGWGVTHFAAIQPAIDAVAEDGTVTVAAGYYTGQGATITKDLSLVGDGASTTTIDATGTNYVSTIHVTDGAIVNVSGFTIIGQPTDPTPGTTGGGRGIGYYSHASGTIANNKITGSTHGIFILGGSSPTITNNIITGNGPGISITGGGNPTITNNIIAENGDAICNMGGSPMIANNTITKNLGSGITNSGGGHPTITNNIISSHSGAGIWAARDSLPTCTYNDFWDNVPDYSYPEDAGEGSISENPLLDETYHLTAGSPCIDAGTDAGVYTDMDGDTRPQGDGFDIGADEWTPNIVVVTTAETEQITAINVEPGSIDFGSLKPGEAVPGDDISVTNIGTVIVDVSAALAESGTVFKYLKLDGNAPPSSWRTNDLLGGQIVTVTTLLDVPRDYSAKGPETATLIFTVRTD